MLRKVPDLWAEERAARRQGISLIAGVDEAGRGPLAGPVVAACVILPFDAVLPLLADSKSLSPRQRDCAYQSIVEAALAIGVGIADVDEIDRFNILRATHLAMRRSVEQCPQKPQLALVDGLPVNPFPVAHRAIVKGDASCASIAAASIIAKVTRDRMMDDLDRMYPGYGFGVHRGYATAQHLEALAKLGPCPAHRRSFAPVAQAGGPCLNLRPPEGHVTGLNGEDIAAAHLRRLGWKILERRYRCHRGEIDIVAENGPTLVFVEVKTLRSRENHPAGAVDHRKRARLAEAAEHYLATQGVIDCPCRFDVVEVYMLPDGTARVELINNAFTAGE